MSAYPRKPILSQAAQIRSSALNTFIDSIAISSPTAKLTDTEVERICDLRLTTHREHCDWSFTQETLVFQLESLRRMGACGSLLDFGCGDGIILDVLDKHKLDEFNHIRGVDISALAVQLARKRLLLKCHNRVEFWHVTSSTIPAWHEYFDCAVANFTMHFHISTKFLNWLSDSVRKDGLFVYNDYRFSLDAEHFSETTARLKDAGFEMVDSKMLTLRRRTGTSKDQKIVIMRKVQ
jgi:2-polyprenyl-3-methyl-5-hydroxy-6-metoxy-1,4-benzoquinol methylase